MNAYYKRHYPHSAINRFLRAIDPQQAAELVLRPSREDAPMRDLAPSDITALVSNVCPRDGAHVALSEHRCASMVLDVDLTRSRPMYCSCADGGRLICDNCWLIMAGVMAGYVYMLKAHFGCSQLLACFSGGRGWHMFVLDAHQIDRTQAVHTLANLVPDTAHHVAVSFQELMQQQRGDALVTLADFDPQRRLWRMGVQTAAVVDRRVLALFTDVMVPFFCDEWRTRVLGCDVSVDSAINVAGALLAAEHASHADRSCAGCAVVRAYNAAADMFEAAAHRRSRTQDSSLPAVRDRVDAFLAITALLWEQPDANLMSARHPIRLPWSPHERSGRFSLPLPLTRAHELCPQSQPPLLEEVGSANTTGDAWFRLSLQVMDDLLGNCQRAPSVLVWPT